MEKARDMATNDEGQLETRYMLAIFDKESDPYNQIYPLCFEYAV